MDSETSQTRHTSPARRQLASGLVVALALTGLRGALFAAKDAYLLVPDLAEVAGRSLLRDLAHGALVCVPAGLVLAWLIPRASGRRLLQALLVAIAFVLVEAFLLGWLPRSPFHTAELSSGRGWAAHGLVLVVAVAACRQLAKPGRVVGRLAGAGAAAALVLAAVGAWLVAGGERQGSRPSVILVSIDTVRADRLGAYGSTAGATPALDALARQSMLFTRAYSPRPWTLSAHMSLLTSLSPSVHGLDKTTRLPPDVTTLAQSFADAGYVTAAVVDTVPWLDPGFGFGRGFHVYRPVYGDASAKDAHLRMLLDDVADAPLFLFVHLYDAHSDFTRMPYESHPDDESRFAGWYTGDFAGCGADLGCATELLDALNQTDEQLQGDELAYLASLYEAGLASLDRRLGVLIDELLERGVLDRSVLLVTSDHGEELFDHGLALHEQYYEECMRVPMMVRLPHGERRGEHGALVSLMDVAPTLRDVVGLPAVDSQGVSFADVLRGGDGGGRRTHVLLDDGKGGLGLVTSRWKLHPGEAGPQLYDLQVDPRESIDLLSAEAATGDASRLLPPGTLAELERLLDAERATMTARRRALGLPEDPAEVPEVTWLDDEAIAELRALGYVGDDG